MAESGNRRVGLAYPHDRFEHGVSGVEPITRNGVEVPAKHLAAVKKAAEQHGVPLVEGDEVEAQTPQPEASGQAPQARRPSTRARRTRRASQPRASQAGSPEPERGTAG